MPGISDSAANTTAPKTKLGSHDQAELAAINAAVDRMDAVIPSDPYILTIPQDIEPRYHHNYQYLALQWLHQTPFELKEGEWMQYQTFIYHEHGRDMFVLHNSRPRDEIGKSRPPTGANTPSVIPKKKISLDAYKKKQSGTPIRDSTLAVKPPGTTPVKQIATKESVERVKAETEEVLASVAEEHAQEITLEKPFEPERKRLKRRREERDEVQAQKPQELTDQEGPARKKVYIKSPPPVTAQPENVLSVQPQPEPAPPAKSPDHTSSGHKKEQDTPMEHTGLPPRLSPLHLPSMPSRLSPTIPPNIEATLKARAQFRASASDHSATNAVNKNGKLTPLKKVDGISKHKSPIPRNGFRANSSSPAVRSDMEEKVPPPHTGAVLEAHTPKLNRDDEIVIGKMLKQNKIHKEKRIVKLKIVSKKNQENVKQLLKVRPQSNRNTSTEAITISSKPSNPVEDAKPETNPTADAKPSKLSSRKRDPTAKGVAQRVVPATTSGTVSKKLDSIQSTTEQRSDAKDSGHGCSPPKSDPMSQSTDTVKKDPSTPIQHASDQASTSQPASTTKAQLATPGVKKDHLVSAGMRRERSDETQEVDTPSAKSTSTPTNSVTSQPNGTAKSSISSKTPAQQAWETEQKRLELMGKELKHASSAHREKGEHSLAAIKAVESLLSFILAFICADQSSIASEPKQIPGVRNWRSLPAFLGFVKLSCADFPVLLGLAGYLGVAFMGRILDLSAQRREAAAPDTCVALLKAAREAEARLDVDAIRKHFPKSWGQRASGSALISERLTEPGKFGGAFKLPITVATPPVQAVRAGYAILREWMEGREGVSYVLRLKI